MCNRFKSLISSSADKSAKVWTFGAESSKIDKTLTGHSHSVFCATFAPGGKIVANMATYGTRTLLVPSMDHNLYAIDLFTGEQTLFPPGRQTHLADIADGTTSTLMIVEAGEAVPWTKPDDLPYDPNKPVPKLGLHYPGGFMVLLADGSVRTLPPTVDEKTLRALITRNGGEEIDPDKIP